MAYSGANQGKGGDNHTGGTKRPREHKSQAGVPRGLGLFATITTGPGGPTQAYSLIVSSGARPSSLLIPSHPYSRGLSCSYVAAALPFHTFGSNYTFVGPSDDVPCTLPPLECLAHHLGPGFRHKTFTPLRSSQVHTRHTAPSPVLLCLSLGHVQSTGGYTLWISKLGACTRLDFARDCVRLVARNPAVVTLRVQPRPAAGFLSLFAEVVTCTLSVGAPAFLLGIFT